MSKRAVILAGGRGTRLRPYTLVLPKPLMPIGDYPILEIIVRQLAGYGFDHLTFAVNHHANIVKAFFGGGEQWNVKIDYSMESQPLSTIAPLRLIDDLPETFLLMNGDILTDLNFANFFQEHRRSHNRFTIAATKRQQQIDYGVLHATANGLVNAFEEKPSTSYLVSMGIYAMNRAVLATVPHDTPYGFDHLMRDLLAAGEPIRIIRHEGYWLDIGRPDDYARAVDEFERQKTMLMPYA